MYTSFYSRATNKYKISRRGRAPVIDEQRLLAVLPKDVPEKTWLEIFQKEENDFVVFDIREEILEEALQICYDRYLERQTPLFTSFCAQEALLKLVDWHFYRHDPGEDPEAYPPCFIPKRVESWIPDPVPDPSPKDTWQQQNLPIQESIIDEEPRKWPSIESLDYPVVEDIPKEFWFPGKVKQEGDSDVESYEYETEATSDGALAADSEVLQKVTDYSTDNTSIKDHSTPSVPKLTTPVASSLRGAGDSSVAAGGHHAPLSGGKRRIKSNKSFASRPSVNRSMMLPPLDRESRSLRKNDER